MLPKRHSVSLEALACLGVSFRLASRSSMTPLPPVCSRKCSKALLKSGRYVLSSATLACKAGPATLTTSRQTDSQIKVEYNGGVAMLDGVGVSVIGGGLSWLQNLHCSGTSTMKLLSLASFSKTLETFNVFVFTYEHESFWPANAFAQDLIFIDDLVSPSIPPTFDQFVLQIDHPRDKLPGCSALQHCLSYVLKIEYLSTVSVLYLT